MDIMHKAGAWVIGLTHVSVMLLTLGIVWQVLFGNAIPFIGGDVVGNIRITNIIFHQYRSKPDDEVLLGV